MIERWKHRMAIGSNEHRQFYPNASVAVIHERTQHSPTLVGVWFRISSTLAQTGYRGFADQLATHEGNIAGQVAADITVRSDDSIDRTSRNAIEVLVLED